MNDATAHSIQTREVTGKRMLDEFIRVPWTIYRDDPHWIAPLVIERRQAFADSHPFFQHAKWQAWIAYRDGAPTGRISAQIDELHLQQNGDLSLIHI